MLFAMHFTVIKVITALRQLSNFFFVLIASVLKLDTYIWHSIGLCLQIRYLGLKKKKKNSLTSTFMYSPIRMSSCLSGNHTSICGCKVNKIHHLLFYRHVQISRPDQWACPKMNVGIGQTTGRTSNLQMELVVQAVVSPPLKSLSKHASWSDWLVWKY